MADLLPPQPSNSPPDSPFWNDWYNKLRALVNNASNFLFTALNFSGSSLTLIQDRQHNDLQDLQGGNGSDQYYHLSSDAYTILVIKTKAGAPTTTDVPVGSWAIYKDSTGGSIKLYANDGGTLKSVALI